MPNYDRVTALRDLNGYDLHAQLSAVTFLLSVASNRDVVGILVDHLFDSHAHDLEAIKKRQKTGKKYFDSVAERILSGLFGAASPLGPDEKKRIAEDIVSDHGNSHLKMWACRYLSSQDQDPIVLEQVEGMLSSGKNVSPECDAVDFARFIWEGNEVRQDPEKAFAIASLVLEARPEMANLIKHCLSIPSYVPRLKNSPMATWALERLIREHPNKKDAYYARHMALSMEIKSDLLEGRKDIPVSMLKALTEAADNFNAEDHTEYGPQMMSLLNERAWRTKTSAEAIETIEALPAGEASAYVEALGSTNVQHEFPKDEFKRVILYRMLADPKSAPQAIETIAADPKPYVQEAAKLILEDKYMAHRELAIKKLIPALANVSDKEYMVKIIDSLPGKMRTMALVLAASTWKVWSPGEMAQMLETESEEVSQSLKELMSEHGLGSLIPYDLERRRNRVLVPPGMPVAFEREL